MGSLMGGWDSPRSTSGGFERSKSLTMEEIENFWKIKRKTEEEHLKAVLEADSITSVDDTAVPEIRDRGKQKFTASLARLDVSKSFPDRDDAVAQVAKNADILRKMKAWWTRSNWAFLNEPPLTEMEGPSYKYAAQYHVADPKETRGIDMLAGQKPDTSTDGVVTAS